MDIKLELWEVHDEFIITVDGKPIGMTVNKHDGAVIKQWLTTSLEALIQQMCEACDQSLMVSSQKQQDKKIKELEEQLADLKMEALKVGKGQVCDGSKKPGVVDVQQPAPAPINKRRLTMEDKRPTQEQIKKLWEWCGFSSNAMKLSEGGWNYPKGGWDINLPSIDLNNLFKYAVPKLVEELAWGKYVDLMRNWIDDVLYEGKDPVLALFWAIWEIV